jgi:methionyl-tRNA synthetase
VDEYLDVFPPDPLRYCFEANAPESKDADFTWKDFQAKNNSELADVIGNLINRCLSFVEKHFEFKVPAAGQLSETDRAVFTAIGASTHRIGSALEDFQLRRATGELMDLARLGNKYFNDAAPWTFLKSDRARCATILNTAIQLQAALAVLMEPFLPFSAERLWRMLNAPGSNRDQRWNGVPNLRLADNHPLGKREILFSKIEDSVIEAQIAKLHS